MVEVFLAEQHVLAEVRQTRAGRASQRPSSVVHDKIAAFDEDDAVRRGQIAVAHREQPATRRGVGEGRRLSTDKNDGFTELLLNADLRPGGATRQESGG